MSLYLVEINESISSSANSSKSFRFTDQLIHSGFEKRILTIGFL